MTTLSTEVSPDPVGDDFRDVYRRGDFWFFAGCILCGTFVLGPIGGPMLVFGMYLIRKAQRGGMAIRPWTVTMIGGLVLVDSAGNGLGWGLDLLAPHTWAGRTMWTGWGQGFDGGYAFFYNSTLLGGVAAHGEKAVQFGLVLLIMPMKGMAAWGFLKMKRWGLQWLIIANWLYLFFWTFYAANMSLNFEERFGTSDYGVIGFWLVGGIPFCGPVVLLPYLHTVNKDLWK